MITTKLTPPQLAKQWGVSPDKIIGHLNRNFFKVSRTAVVNVLEQLRAQAFLPNRNKAPVWLNPIDGDLHKKWDTNDLLVTKNAIIHLPTMLDGD